MATSKEQDDSLKRLGGGRWQTRDARFTIEPQSGTWAVVDAEQMDDLGLPLVRGPFGSLGAAKEAIASARVSAPVVSPLATKLAELRDRPVSERPADGDPNSKGHNSAAKPAERGSNADPAPQVRRAPKTATPRPEPPAEPKWLRDLAPADRRRAYRLIAALRDAGASDAEGIVRRDISGGVPAVAAFAIARVLADLGPEPRASDVVRVLNKGRDAGLDVTWRLVDSAGRPISLD